MGPCIRYQSPSCLVAGNGARLELGREMRHLDAHRALVVISPSVARHTPMREDVCQQWHGCKVQWFTGVESDSPLSSVEMALTFEPASMVAIGAAAPW